MYHRALVAVIADDLLTTPLVMAGLSPASVAFSETGTAKLVFR